MYLSHAATKRCKLPQAKESWLLILRPSKSGRALPERTSSGEGREEKSGGGAGAPDRSTQETSTLPHRPIAAMGSKPGTTMERFDRLIRRYLAKAWGRKKGEGNFQKPRPHKGRKEAANYRETRTVSLVKMSYDKQSKNANQRQLHTVVAKFRVWTSMRPPPN